jgi:hypothetical protein
MTERATGPSPTHPTAVERGRTPRHARARRPLRWVWAWIRRQWSSVVLVGTGWTVLVGAARLDQDSDELAGISLAVGALLVVIGALHHRGLSGSAGPLNVSVPPDPSGEITKRIAERPDQPTAEELADDETDDAARYLLGERSLRDMVLRPAEPLSDCRGQVWLFDDDLHVLYGILEPGHPGDVTFAPGEGAVGRSWVEGQYVIAEGEDVVSPEFGLDAEKIARYADLTAAAAVSVFNAAGRRIAVLSMSSRSSATQLGSAGALEHMVFLSEVTARVLVDLFKWFDDGSVEASEEDR